MSGYRARHLAGRLLLHGVLLSAGLLFLLPFAWSISISPPTWNWFSRVNSFPSPVNVCV